MGSNAQWHDVYFGTDADAVAQAAPGDVIVLGAGTHTEDLKHWWKIFHAAGENWTVPTENWEGTSWGYFTGDDEAMKTMAGRIVENMRRLKIDTLLWPE